MAFLESIPKVTRNILLINFVIFIACQVNKSLMVTQFALFFPVFSSFRIWQYVTYMFTHLEFGHLFFNMYSLLIFGSVIERTLGEKKYLILYFASGIGGALFFQGVQYVQFLLGSTAGLFHPCVGASGAIYGLLLAYGLLYPNNKLTLLFPPITMSARSFVLIFIALELLMGIFATQDGVAHFAHLGGALFAWILISWWKKKGNIFTW